MAIDNNSDLRGIAYPVERDRQHILHAGERLRACCSPAGLEHLQQALAPLGTALAQVAIVGQVKAGKTTLINSLVRKPQLLPTDVNPLTAVVTRLYFGAPFPGKARARFQFFNRDEWDRLMTRGGRLGELGASVDEGYRRDEILAQVAEIKRQAELRLSSQFHHLLGKHHNFKDVTPEIIASYICDGDPPEGQVRRAEVGRFSDITKSAELYFEAPPFAFPTVVLDTPGLNDPLLVREELTKQALEHADVFVLVLSAHQALSTADVGLIRLLSALRLERLVVFINRIDELPEPEAQVPEVMSSVRDTLATECGHSAIPVLAGSGVWAQHALAGGAPDFDAGALHRYARWLGLDLDNDAAPSSDAFKAVCWRASGLPALEDALSQQIEEGVGRPLLRSASTDLDNLAQALRSQLDAERSNGKRRRDPAEDLGRAAADLRIRVEALVRQSFGTLRASLHRDITRFVDAEVARFVKMRSADKVLKEWSCDPNPLRRTLQATFGAAYADAQRQVCELVDDGAAAILARLARDGHEVPDALSVNTVGLSADPPPTTALAQVVSLDLQFSWMSGLFAGFGRGARQERDLERLIRSEFGPIVETLVVTAMPRLVKVAEAAVDKYVDLIAGLTAHLGPSGRRLAVAVPPDTAYTLSAVAQSVARLTDRHRPSSRS